MSLYHAIAGQAEIIRTIQKDQTYIDELRSNLSDMLLMISQKNWFKYNHLCKLIAEISYHHYAILNNLQTLGEEYTGIIQVDSQYSELPNKAVQILSICLEYGGEYFVTKFLAKLQNEIRKNDDFIPEVREKFIKWIDFIKIVVPYVNGIHSSVFYIKGGRYHISKQLTSINYILVRNWLKENHSVYGFKLLGIFTLLQLLLSLVIKLKQQYLLTKSAATVKSNQFSTSSSSSALELNKNSDGNSRTCTLCMEPLTDITVTECGHLFCWFCILNWLDEKEICPICRETIKKSKLVPLQNY
uniref:RING-type E3 ubiquitin transferase n=1 Tax=Corethrella appendiculata TaxID=1370023 RepID=U5EZB7_9DIPT